MKTKMFVILLLAVSACSASPAAAHASDPRNVDATSFGQRITLGPEWLFAPGDNPAWASPAFDDSGWRVVSSNKELLGTASTTSSTAGTASTFICDPARAM